MDLRELLYHNVSVEFTDGGDIEGYVTAYVSAEDNEPETESIILVCRNTHYEICIDEIKKATILDN